jgi:putative ABC transport system permease protein
LRRDIDAGGAQRWVDYALGAISVFGLMWWYSGDLRVTGSVVAGLSLTVGAGYCAAQLLLRGGRVLGSAAGSVWRLALANLQRRGAANALQMVIFAIAIMLMLVLVIIRGALIDQWQAQLPPGSPNHFMLNITADERASLASFLSERGIESQPQFPMTRGRVMAVNGEKLAAADSAQSQRRQREANFTYADSLPEANEIIAGEWWDADTDEAQVSLEEEFAQRVGATVGDLLELRIASESFEARVSSLRESDWQSMKPNFFVIFPRKNTGAVPQNLSHQFLPACGAKGAAQCADNRFSYGNHH